jgi:hypothetical protein
MVDQIELLINSFTPPRIFTRHRETSRIECCWTEEPKRIAGLLIRWSLEDSITS